MNELEDFVQKMITENPDYRNKIIYLYRQCADNIIDSVIDKNDNFSKKDEIESCIKSITELCKQIK